MPAYTFLSRRFAPKLKGIYKSLPSVGRYVMRQLKQTDDGGAKVEENGIEGAWIESDTVVEVRQ